jgi:co-chaperonin GroES (HSP10)
MIQARNTLVILRLLEKSERSAGAIVVPTNADMMCEAEVMAVGPGCVQAAGGLSETHDLRPGQIVLVRHKSIKQTPMGRALSLDGTEYREGDKLYYLYEQMSVFAIIQQPNTLEQKATSKFQMM